MDSKPTTFLLLDSVDSEIKEAITILRKADYKGFSRALLLNVAAKQFCKNLKANGIASVDKSLKKMHKDNYNKRFGHVNLSKM